MLRPDQLEAVARIQRAMVRIEQLRRSVNDLTRTHGLAIRPLHTPALGYLLHDIDGLLFAHDCAAKKADSLGLMEAAA